MKLNQLSLTVDDVAAASHVLERYFGLNVSGEAHKNLAMLRDDGMTLTLMGAGAEAVSYPRSFHLGFILPSEHEVDDLHRRLAKDGYEVGDPKRRHGAWSFGLEAPSGFRIAVRSAAPGTHG